KNWFKGTMPYSGILDLLCMETESTLVRVASGKNLSLFGNTKKAHNLKNWFNGTMPYSRILDLLCLLGWSKCAHQLWGPIKGAKEGMRLLMYLTLKESESFSL
ncbi:hypothetical protein ACJX0J_019917, partial [Zea mays]